MSIKEITVENISQLKENALKKNEDNELFRREKKLLKERDFLSQLRDSSHLFIETLMERAWMELQDCASKGFLKKKFYFANFKEKFGPVRISTLVKGFHVRDTWDASIFEKIDKTTTPFLEAVNYLAQKGITLKDVSDISKGTGFWLEVSFENSKFS